MPSERSQKGPQRAGHDHADSQATALRIRPQRAHRGWRELEGDRHRRLEHLDRRVELGCFFEVTIGLTQREAKLARQTLRRLGQSDVALKQAMRHVQLPSLVRFGRSGHAS